MRCSDFPPLRLNAAATVRPPRDIFKGTRFRTAGGIPNSVILRFSKDDRQLAATFDDVMLNLIQYYVRR